MRPLWQVPLALGRRAASGVDRLRSRGAVLHADRAVEGANRAPYPSVGAAGHHAPFVVEAALDFPRSPATLSGRELPALVEFATGEAAKELGVVDTLGPTAEARGNPAERDERLPFRVASGRGAKPRGAPRPRAL